MPAKSLFTFWFLAVCSVTYVAEGRLFATRSKENDDRVVPTEAKNLLESETDAGTISVSHATNEFNKFAQFSQDDSMCDRINPEKLPEECSCSEPSPLGLLIECDKPFNSTYFTDTIGMKIVLEPCDENGAKLSIEVTEKNHGIDFPIAGIAAGDTENIPIPGYAMIIPGVGNVGLDVSVMIAGNPDILRLKVGLNACAQTSTNHQLCASSIPPLSNIFPWWVLKGAYNFGDICDIRLARAGLHNTNDNKEETDIVTE
mmetsp:Transcript_291/g.741  ORF Transcript_291/g.741 Transcript_291/m.741 type:complete len:258 (-) Transcript_291:4197-4970(-)